MAFVGAEKFSEFYITLHYITLHYFSGFGIPHKTLHVSQAGTRCIQCIKLGNRAVTDIVCSPLRLVDLNISLQMCSIYLEASAPCDVTFLSSSMPLYAFSGPEEGPFFALCHHALPAFGLVLLVTPVCLAGITFCDLAQYVNIRQIVGGSKTFSPHELVQVAWDHILRHTSLRTSLQRTLGTLCKCLIEIHVAGYQLWTKPSPSNLCF